MEQIYDPSPDEAVYQSVRAALETARTKAAAAINDAMVSAYWEIGRQIVEAQGDRAEYGQHLMEYLSERLTAEFGKGSRNETFAPCASCILHIQFGTHCVPN